MSDPLASALLLGHGVWVATLSVAAFVVYGADKRRAKRNKRRIPERTLHQFAWWGGAPGAWLGRTLWRHKTRKRGFTIRIALAMTIHVALAVTLVWFRTLR